MRPAMRGQAGRAALAGGLALVLWWSAGDAGPVPPADAEKIAAAAPTTAPAKPAKPRKLLVFGVCRDYRHAVIEHGAEALKVMGGRTGAFEAVVSDDIALFEPDRIGQFDAICFNNSSGDVFLPADFGKLPPAEKDAARQRQQRLAESLRRFVAGGGGFVAIHCGMWCLRDWPEFASMVGAKFVSHPWNGKVTVKLDEPGHPLNAALEGKGFEVLDEIYQFTEPYSRARQRVLLSLDLAATPNKGQRADGDYGLSWIMPYGKGRVFYFALGHYKEIFMERRLMGHLLAGVQFALGDLQADATPAPAAAAAPAKGEKAADAVEGR